MFSARPKKRGFARGLLALQGLLDLRLSREDRAPAIGALGLRVDVARLTAFADVDQGLGPFPHVFVRSLGFVLIAYPFVKDLFCASALGAKSLAVRVFPSAIMST